MRFLVSTLTALASFSALSIVFINAHAIDSEGPFKKRHLVRLLDAPQLRNEHQNNSLARSFDFEKRFENARFSLYDAGLGACGKVNMNSDFIVALNVPQYGGGEHCFETITISYKGKKTQAQVVDKCMECPYGAIDLSRGLFNFFGASDGYLYGTWNFGSGAPPPPSSTTKPEPTPKPQPSTTKQSTTTTSKAKPTSTFRPTTTSESTTLSTTSSATPSAIPSSTSSNTIPAAPTGFLSQLNMALIELGGLAVAAAQTD